MKGNKTFFHICCYTQCYVKKYTGYFLVIIRIHCKNLTRGLLPVLGLMLLVSIPCLAQPRFGKEQGFLRFRNREMMINPAYVGTADETYKRLSLGAAWQWVGMEGAPKAQELQFHSGLANAGGVGGWLYHESYGVSNVIQLAGVYSYSIKLAEGHNLSLGLSLSALTVGEGTVLGIDNPNDPIFAQSSSRAWGFNSGFGTMYYTDKYYLGLSTPQLLTNSWEEGSSELKLKNAFKLNQLQFYVIGGYAFEVGDGINIIPNALLQLSGSTSFGYELMVRGDYKRRVTVGIGYGYDKVLKAEADVFISGEVSVGYRYEQSFGSTYKYLSGSHIVNLSVTWNRDKHRSVLF